jgi:hypothetical protein
MTIKIPDVVTGVRTDDTVNSQLMVHLEGPDGRLSTGAVNAIDSGADGALYALNASAGRAYLQGRRADSGLSGGHAEAQCDYADQAS